MSIFTFAFTQPTAIAAAVKRLNDKCPRTVWHASCIHDAE